MTNNLDLLYQRRDLLAMRIKVCQDPTLRENLLTDYLKIQTQITVVKNQQLKSNQQHP